MSTSELLRVAVGACSGLGVCGVGVALGLRALPDLRRHPGAGRPVDAVVVRTEAEPVEHEAGFHDWTVVDLTTAEGRVMHDVRLRTWSTVPPRPGRSLRVYHRPEDPTDADRSRWPLLVGRLVAAAAVVVLGAVVTFVVVGWG